MRIDVVTLFPSMVNAPLSESIVGRARSSGLLALGFSNPRDFSEDRHRTVDDKLYGGGTGMLLMAEPVYRALKEVKKRDSFVILLTPKGRKFDQPMALELAQKKRLVFICGHYEGIDERVNDFADLELSIGDYVLSGGEPAAVVIIDAVTRLLPGVLKREDATVNETFSMGLLEAPHYTRPEVWRKKKIPDALMSGNHKLISQWRHDAARALTGKRRPDLMRNLQMDVDKKQEGV